jgi:hypothetical protein
LKAVLLTHRLFWSRGIYFAEDSVYSHSYAFKPEFLPATAANDDGRPVGEVGEREIFYAKLLIGNAITMHHDSQEEIDRCRDLTLPPFIDERDPNLRYNTVTGTVADSQVWIVYENGRAYPDYLVRYYRGERDPDRTPFAFKHEVLSIPVRTESLSDDSSSGALEEGWVTVPIPADVPAANPIPADVSQMLWEFRDNSAWRER